MKFYQKQSNMLSTRYRLELTDICCRIKSQGPVTLDERIWMYGNTKAVDIGHDVIVEFDCNKLTPDNFQILVELSSILKESGEVGEMELEIFKLHIKSLKTYEKELINVV